MVREDLIANELRLNKHGFSFKKFRLHNSLINKLQKNYDLIEACQNFYDSDIEDKNRRMEFLTWQEVIGPGIWFATQKEANEQAFGWLEWIRKLSLSKEKRLYIAERDELILIYFYGRDYWEDYWFVFGRKGGPYV